MLIPPGVSRQEIPATHFILGGEKMPVLRNVRGHTVRVGSVLLREVTPVGRDSHGFLRIRIGKNEVIAYTTEPVERQTWIRPLVEDAEVRRARAFYSRHHVYPIGPYKVGFTSPFGTSERSLTTAKSLNIRRIIKIAMPPTRLGYDGRWKNVPPAGGTTNGLLVAILFQRIPSRDSLASLSQKGNPPQSDVVLKENANVPAVARFLNLGHMQSRLGLKDPGRTYSWPIRTWWSIRRGEVKAGMTKQMVEWTLGLPWEPGSPKAQMMKDRWSYGASIVEFRDGKVAGLTKSKQ